MSEELRPLNYFGPQVRFGRRRGTPLWKCLGPLFFTTTVLVITARVCNPYCCGWIPSIMLRFGFVGAFGCANKSCAACGWLFPTIGAWIASIVWMILVILLQPAKYISRGPGAIVEIDPQNDGDDVDIWYCPQDLAAFVRERMYLQNRDASTLLRLKQAITRWMDDREILPSLRPSYMAGALACALTVSREEQSLNRLLHTVASPDSRAWPRE